MTLQLDQEIRAGQNLYAYVSGRVLEAADPYGLAAAPTDTYERPWRAPDQDEYGHVVLPGLGLGGSPLYRLTVKVNGNVMGTTVCLPMLGCDTDAIHGMVTQEFTQWADKKIGTLVPEVVSRSASPSYGAVLSTSDAAVVIPALAPDITPKQFKLQHKDLKGCPEAAWGFAPHVVMGPDGEWLSVGVAQFTLQRVRGVDATGRPKYGGTLERYALPFGDDAPIIWEGLVSGYVDCATGTVWLSEIVPDDGMSWAMK